MPKKHGPSGLSIHHSLVTGGRKLYEAVRSLTDCQTLNVGAIRGQSSSKRGVLVENNGLGVLVEFHADNGIQQFHVSPVKGVPLTMLADAIVEILSRRGYIILNGGKAMEVKSLPEPKPIAEDRADLARAYQAVLGTVEVGEDNRWRSKSAYNAIGACFPRKDANRIFAMFCSRKILVKDNKSTEQLGTTRSSVYFVQKTEVKVPGFEIRWPAAKKKSHVDISAALAQNPTLLKEALECLWQARADKVSLLKGEVDDLNKEIARLEETRSAKGQEVGNAEKEAEDLERMVLALEGD